MAIGYGTLAQNSATASATSIATTGTVTVSAGDSILCFGSYSAASDKTVTFTDGTNTYTAVGAFRDTTSQFGLSCAVAVAVAAGTYTITATYSASTGSRAVVAIPLTSVGGFTTGEFSTNTQAAPGTGTDAITSGNVTPATVPGDLITMVLNASSSSLPNGGTSQTTRALFWVYGTGSSFARYESRRRTVTTASAGTFTATNGANTYLTFAVFLREATSDVSAALTGQASTVSRGTIAPGAALALTGSAATSASGTLAPVAAPALSGQALSASAGSVAPVVTLSLFGLSATLAQGTIAASGDVTAALTGTQATLALGSLTGANAVAVSGQASTIAQGAFTLSIARALSGSTLTASAGALTPVLSLALSGSALTLSAGVVTAPGNITVALNGQVIASASGSFVPASTTALSGSAATSAGGSLIASPSFGLDGAAATLTAGDLAQALSVALAGQNLTATPGSVLITSGDPTPDEIRRVRISFNLQTQVAGPGSVRVQAPRGVSVH